jgi:hypothetical protein
VYDVFRVVAASGHHEKANIAELLEGKAACRIREKG